MRTPGSAAGARTPYLSPMSTATTSSPTVGCCFTGELVRARARKWSSLQPTWPPQGPIKVNVRSGERLWTTSRRLGTPPALSHGYPAPLLSDGVVYVSFERRLDAFSVTDGRSRFNE